MPIVGPLPILDVVSPSDLDLDGTSGLLTPAQLEVIGPSGKLHKTAARAYRALAFMCMAIGLPLTYTYGGTYRSYADQVTLFTQRYTKTYLPGRPYKVWNGVRWYQMPNTSLAATPGSSNHGWGLAVDTAFDIDPKDGIGPDDAVGITSHPQWPLFKQYVLLCGFSWEATSEPWHIRLVTGDTPTQAVLDYEAFIKPPVSGDDDMQVRLLVLSDAQAQFLAETDSQGQALYISWAGPGDNGGPVDRAVAAHRAEAVRKGHQFEQDSSVAGVFNCVLFGELPYGDAKHTWKKSDFWRTVGA